MTLPSRQMKDISMLDKNLTPSPVDSAELKAERRTNVLWISILALIGLLIAAFVSYRIALQSEVPNFTSSYLAGVFALIALITAVLAGLGFVTLGSGIFMGSILIATLSLPYIAAGQVTAPALAGLLIVSAMAAATLPPPWPLRVGALSLVVSIAVTILDLFTPDTFGIRSPAIAAVPLSIGLSAVYIYFILRRFALYTLRIKLLVAFILVTIVPLAILGLYNNTVTRQNLRDQGNKELENLANLTAAQVDGFISNELDFIRIASRQPAISAFLSLHPANLRVGATRAETLEIMNSLLAADPIFVESVGLLDLEGVNILDTEAKYIGRPEVTYEYFWRTLRSGQAYVSDLTFRDQTPHLYFSSPVREPSGRIIGIIRIEYNGYVLQSIIKPLVKQSGYLLSLVDQVNYVRMAYSGRNYELHKSLRAMSEQNLAALQKQGVLAPGTAVDALAPSEDIMSGLANFGLSPFFNAYSDELGEETITTAAPLQNSNWMVIVSRSESSLFAPLRLQTRGFVLISLVLLFIVAVSSLFASRILMEPITALTQVAERITSGYLTARAQTSTQDEIGILSTAFNNMTYQLRQALTGLENRVRERTADLEASREQSEGRAQKLQAISDVARAISSEQKIENLLPLVTEMVSDKFGFYHTGIFLIDPTGKFAALRAANSEGGRRMLERGHKLEVGHTGIVGYVTATGKPRIALDVGADAVFFNNPDLPETRSEMALPLSLRGETIGALDVQSRQSGAFSEDDISTLSIMADQIAVAIENASLFGRTEQALDEVRALYTQYLRQEWQAFAKQQEKVGYRYTLAGGKLLDEPVQNDRIQRALDRGETIVMDAQDGQDQPAIVIPVKLRGETIGVMNISSPQQGHEWNADELNLVQSVADRLALALENARLLQDSVRRAAKEQKIGQITTRIGASINMRNMLQTAVEELGRALPGSEVVIQFQQERNAAGQNRMAK